MRRNIYLLLCAFFMFGCYQARAVGSPVIFVGGHSQSLTICQNAATTPINTLLSITDPDVGQTETWSVVLPALHGTLVAGVGTFSTGGTVTPSGTSYTPTAGFSGTDSFIVRVSDGTFSDTTTVHVLVNPLPAPISGTATICRGLTTTLSDAGGGTWTSGTTAIATVDMFSGVVSSVATGNATITYTLSTGCKTTRVVTVNPMPNPISGSIFSVCTGLTIGFSDPGGGTWSTVNTAIATINSSTGYLLGVGADTVTIRYTLSTGCSTTAVVTVNQTPAPITGVSTLCLGNTATLTETIPGGIWTSSNTGVATITGGSVTTVSPGTVVFVYTIGACSASKTLTVNPVAPITGINNVCVGASTTLSNIYGGGTWTSGTTGVASVSSSGLVSGVAPGNAVISYTLPTGCLSTATMTVNPVPMPITGVAHVCSGATTLLSEGSIGGSWTSSNTALATVDPASGLVAGLATGTPLIIYSFSTGCKVTTVVTINPLPSPVAGTLSACSGFTLGLVDGGGGTWSSLNTSVATVNPSTGMVSGISAGTSTISYTLASGCGTSVIVTINQTPAAITGPSGICLGALAILGESTPGGIWSSSNTAVAMVSGGSITTVSPGTTIITYAIGTCAATKVITINSISPITGTAFSACVGGTFNLFDAAPGGSWSVASPSIATIGPSGIVTGVGPGTTLVSYALPSGCFTSASITINPLPLPISGVAHLCVGATTILSDAGGGTWTSGITAIATINHTTGELIGLATGAPIITYTLSTGCRTTIVVTVNPMPTPISGTLSVCAGLHTGLVETGGGSWSSSNTLIATIAPTGYVFGLLPGVTTITYAYSTGCSTSVNVTVNPSPTAITGPASICQGDSTTLTDGLAGGVWSSSSILISINPVSGLVHALTDALAPAGISYNVGGCIVTSSIVVNPVRPILGDTEICNGTSTTLTEALAGVWGSSDPSVASVFPSGLVHAFSPGSTVIRYTFTSGCFTTQTFVVDASPAPIEGIRTVCLYATTALSDSIGGGTWSATPFPHMATIDSVTGIVTAIGTGIPTITYTLPGNCRTTTTLTVNPLPSPIYGPVFACPGATLSMVEPGGGTWSSSNTALATINVHTGYVHTVAAGTVTITYNLAGCLATSEITINPLPSPIVGDSMICTGLYDTLTDVGGGTWSTGNETVVYVDSATGIARGHALGSAYIIYTLPTGCKTMKLVTVEACNVGVQQVTTGGDIIISPNPAKGDFMITGSLGTSGDEDVSLTLTNILGQVVYKNKVIVHNGDINEHVQLGSNLANGTYLLTLLSGSEYKTFHIVIQQ